MIKIIKKSEPGFWKDYRCKKKINDYNKLNLTDEGKEVRSKLRRVLIEEQKGVCCYCSSKILESDSHNEHFLPRNSYPEKSMDYFNILCSCNSNNTCGNAKGSQTEKIIFPVDDNPEDIFEYLLDGTIIASNKVGEATISVLNLNFRPLKEKRARVLYDCINMRKYSSKEDVIKYFIEPDEDNKLPRYSAIVKYFIKKGLFDDVEELKGVECII